MPDGVRTLSSSTLNVPSESRTTSRPATAIHERICEPMPSSSGSWWLAPVIARSGTTPSRTMRRLP